MNRAPVFIGEIVAADCAELRDIAEYFEKRGKPSQGEFLRKVADRHEVLFGAYWSTQKHEVAPPQELNAGAAE